MDVQVGTTGDDYAPSYVLRQEEFLPAGPGRAVAFAA